MMLNQSNLIIQELAINLIGNVNVIELKDAVKLKLQDHRIPPPRVKRDGSGSRSSSFTISETAQRAIIKLKQKIKFNI